MNAKEKQESKPYEETLKAAKMIDDIGRSGSKQAASPQKGEPGSEAGLDQKANSLTPDSERPEKPGKESGAVEQHPAPPGPAEAQKESGQRADKDHPSAGSEKRPGEPSIGELFSKLVRNSPPEKIRIDKNSIGSLFKKYINKRG